MISRCPCTLELHSRGERPLVRHQKQSPGRRIPRPGLRQTRSPSTALQSWLSSLKSFAADHHIALPSPSIRKANWLPRSRPTTPSASASASSTLPPSGWSPPTPRGAFSSRLSTAASSSSSSTRPSQTPARGNPVSIKSKRRTPSGMRRFLYTTDSAQLPV